MLFHSQSTDTLRAGGNHSGNLALLLQPQPPPAWAPPLCVWPDIQSASTGSNAHFKAGVSDSLLEAKK